MYFLRKSLKIRWAFLFVAKILCFVAIVDIAVLPVLWILRVPLPQAYVPVTCGEGLFIALIGVLLLLNSLSSTVIQGDDRYAGFGTIRHGVRFRKLKDEEKHLMRKRGTVMVAIGMIMSIPTLNLSIQWLL